MPSLTDTCGRLRVNSDVPYTRSLICTSSMHSSYSHRPNSFEEYPQGQPSAEALDCDPSTATLTPVHTFRLTETHTGTNPSPHTQTSLLALDIRLSAVMTGLQHEYRHSNGEPQHQTIRHCDRCPSTHTPYTVDRCRSEAPRHDQLH